jgi:hypothetical protein
VAPKLGARVAPVYSGSAVQGFHSYDTIKEICVSLLINFEPVHESGYEGCASEGQSEACILNASLQYYHGGCRT